MKETGGEVVGDVTKVLNGLVQRFHVHFLLLHLTDESQVALTNLRPGVLLLISQDLSRLMHQPVSALQWREDVRQWSSSPCRVSAAAALEQVEVFFFLDTSNGVAHLSDAIV